MNEFVGRKKELSCLKEFITSPKAGFTYLRGRRRVGKSWLLKEFQKGVKGCFYFSGAADETGRITRRRLAEKWDEFSQDTGLAELGSAYLTWSRIFKEISEYEKKENKPLVLIFDEIQWIAKKGSGFVGLLKEAWVDWERSGKIKVIVCGSSNKFFKEKGGDEKILRGLKTRGSIWVNPFTLAEVRCHFFPEWTMEEVCLLYMMLGGIPYYLARISSGLGFIQAINRAVFTESTIFLEEVDEILGLEFNRRGINTVKKILAALGQDGAAWQTILIRTGISPAGLTEVLERLIDYEIIFKKLPANSRPVKNEGGYRYFLKDFFLNFYFQILDPLQIKIKNNSKGLIFPYECICSTGGYYIPDFSGKAFELLVRYILENRKESKAEIFNTLFLSDKNYTVETYWDSNTQVDLIIENPADRISRIVECKWISKKADSSSKYISEVLSKSYTPPEGFKKMYYLVLSKSPSGTFSEKAREKGVRIILLKDLF